MRHKRHADKVLNFTVKRSHALPSCTRHVLLIHSFTLALVCSLENETYPNSMRNNEPRLTCDEVDESRSPFREVHWPHPKLLTAVFKYDQPLMGVDRLRSSASRCLPSSTCCGHGLLPLVLDTSDTSWRQLISSIWSVFCLALCPSC